MNFAQQAIATLLAAAFKRSEITPVKWAETVRRMNGGKRFSFDYAPYQREIFESFFDEEIAITVMALFSRGGKTELVTNLFGYSIAERPREMIMARPSEKSAEHYSKNEFQGKLINPTPQLSEILPDGNGRRLGNNTITSKYFPGGFINFIGVNSGGTTRTVQGDVICCDEIDSYSTEQTDEGDKVDGVLGRADEYPNPIKVLTSYPLYAGDSHIWRWLARSDWRQWFVGCPRCGHEYVLHRNQISWPKGDPSKAVLICPKCAGDISDAERVKMVRDGEWRPTREFSGIRGYQANGMIWPHSHQRAYRNFLHQVATQVEAVDLNQNPDKAMMVLVNRFDSEPFSPKEIAKADPSLLMLQREDYQIEGLIPAGVLAITFGADVQGDRIELEFVGHGENEETWGLGYHVVSGKPERASTWDKLTELISKKWVHPQRGEIGIDGGCIDSKYRPDNVRAWAVKHRTKHVYAITGSVVLGKPIISKPRSDMVTMGTRRRMVQIYDVGTHEVKDRIYQRLLLSKPDGGEYPHGYPHYAVADCYDERYFEGLTLEVPEMKRASDGEWYRHFSAKSGQRNEPLDCRVYAIAAKEISRPPIAARSAKISGKTVRVVEESGENVTKPRRKGRKWPLGGISLGRANPF